MLLQAKPPLFISAFQGSLSPPVTHKNQSSATEAVAVSVISEQKTLSCYSPFTRPIWDENKLLQNMKHSFSTSFSESKLSLFIDQVSWNDKQSSF